MSVLEAQGEADVAAVETGRRPHSDMAEELNICVLVLVASIERLAADHLGIPGKGGARPPHRRT
jgi:hypothetical protein